MNDCVASLLTEICRAYVTGDSSSLDVGRLDASGWEQLYDACACHGITAIGYAVTGKAMIGRSEARGVKLKWALSVERIESRYRRMLALAAEAGDALSAAGIDAVVFKGPALSRYYRCPWHREFGDLDIYTGTAMDRSSAVLAASGAQIGVRTLKNTHIVYKGLTIENHCYTTDARGRRSNRDFELLMRRLLAQRESCDRIDGVQMSSPPVMFTALHTLRHALHHYLWESIALRHLLDWALLVEAEQDNIDWRGFYSLCDRYHLRRFADALTSIAADRFGARLLHPDITSNRELGDMIFADVIASREKGHSTQQHTRLHTLHSFVTGRWKFREICDRSFAAEMFYLMKGALFQRRLRF